VTRTHVSNPQRAESGNVKMVIPVAVFRLRRIVATPNALESLTPDDILQGIQRHQAGDWGNLPDDDRTSNDRALAQGGRIFSAYHAHNGTRFWIITESDRSVTTVLLPEDY
jgi:hypothetical protein